MLVRAWLVNLPRRAIRIGIDRGGQVAFSAGRIGSGSNGKIIPFLLSLFMAYSKKAAKTVIGIIL